MGKKKETYFKAQKKEENILTEVDGNVLTNQEPGAGARSCSPPIILHKIYKELQDKEGPKSFVVDIHNIVAGW